MARSALIALIAASFLFGVVGRERAAEAQLKGDPKVISTTMVGLAGGVASNVAGIVYALEDRAFDSPWVVTSLIGSAWCTALAGAFVVDAGQNGFDTTHALLVLSLAALAAWPAYWTIKGAVLDVDPGDFFEEPETEAQIALRRARSNIYASATVLRF